MAAKEVIFNQKSRFMLRNMEKTTRLTPNNNLA